MRFIVMLIGAALILGAMYGGYKLSYKIWLFSTHAHQEATVILCKARKSYSSGVGKSTSRWRTIKYTPIAKTAQGDTIIGSAFGDYESCRQLIGKKIPVIIDNSVKQGGYILTFTQFWMGPIALLAGTLLPFVLFVYPLLLAIRRREL